MHKKKISFTELTWSDLSQTNARNWWLQMYPNVYLETRELLLSTTDDDATLIWTIVTKKKTKISKWKTKQEITFFHVTVISLVRSIKPAYTKYSLLN